jgi:endo-1,4-beta-xylanase
VQGAYNFTRCEGLADFAAANDMEFRFHTLVWFDYNPQWVWDLPEEDKEAVLVEHVKKTAEYFCDRVSAFDVVNEALDVNGDLRTDHPWANFDYITLAFETAREACPGAKLFYNDFDVASAQGWSKPKSDGVYRLAQDLDSKGLIDGVGLQSHIFLDYDLMDGVRENMDRIAALGLEVQVTELDISCGSPFVEDYACEVWDDAQEQRQADLYAELLDVCLERPACTSFTLWGFTDTYTWLTGIRGVQYPLPFEEFTVDGLYAPKPAFFAMVDALESH